MNDTGKLRMDLSAKQAEYNALMAGTHPDPKAAARLSREITGLREQIRTKAREFGVTGPGGNGSYGRHMGHSGPYCCGAAHGGWRCR